MFNLVSLLGSPLQQLRVHIVTLTP